MVKLFCFIVGVAGNAFPVDINESESVGDLKKSIQAENSKTITCDAKDLQLFLAKTEGGAWLPDDDPAALELEKGKTHQNIQKMTGERTPKARQIHVLVVVPGGAGVSVAPAEPLPIPTAMHRRPERLKRWAAINELVRQKNQEENEKTSNPDTNTRKRKNRDLDRPMSYSSLSWADLEPILPMEDFNLQAKPVSDKVAEELRDRLVQVRKLYGDIYSGKEAKCQIFILAIIEAVCVMLGDATIVVEEDVKGKNVNVYGRFEFVLKRGEKRVSIVEAKQDDIPQGMAQNVAGLEALSDAEGLERTFGIVTNYLEWVFISDEDEKIRRVNETLKIRGSVPSVPSLREIVGMIYALLTSNAN